MVSRWSLFAGFDADDNWASGGEVVEFEGSAFVGGWRVVVAGAVMTIAEVVVVVVPAVLEAGAMAGTLSLSRQLLHLSSHRSRMYSS